MEKAQRQLNHLAELIHQQLRAQAEGRLGHVVFAVQNLLGNLASLGRLAKLLAICSGRGWDVAAREVCDRIRQGLREMSYCSTNVEQVLDLAKGRGSSVRDILADLKQAQEEFDDFQYLPDKKTLSVVVGPVELEGVQLGEFEVRLQVHSMAQTGRSSGTYRVVALDPNPAGCNSSVSHPHVSDERMCEGDASAAIRAALTNGRVCDFFQLVSAVLTTYNPHSPYVSLDNWNGKPCEDCGATIGEDDRYTCSWCENDLCGDCISSCQCCDASTCPSCLARCSACGEMICPSCKTTCPECGEGLCRTCLEEALCPCLEETQPDEEEDHDSIEQPVPACGAGEGSDTVGVSAESGPGQTGVAGGLQVALPRVEAA